MAPVFSHSSWERTQKHCPAEANREESPVAGSPSPLGALLEALELVPPLAPDRLKPLTFASCHADWSEMDTGPIRARQC